MVAQVLDGAGARPPEDVGGTDAYAEFLEAVRNPDHSEREEWLEWADGEWDADEFDRVTAQRRLTGAARRGHWSST